MDADLTLLADRLSQAVGDYRTTATTTVSSLAHAVDVIDADLPMGRLDVLFRSPHVMTVAVRDPAEPDRMGLVTRTRYTAAMTGRLGFGRAVHARRTTGDVADWAPLVAPPDAPVSEVAVRAMERHDERRYDDVLVAGDVWAVASTADLVHALSTLLAVRSLHDPLTGLEHRSMLHHRLAQRCADEWGTTARVALVLLDVRDFRGLNVRRGHAFGDVVLAALGARLRAVSPVRTDVARTGGDELALAATLHVRDDGHAAAVADGLRAQLVERLATPAAGIDPADWPELLSVVVWSEPGSATPDGLLRDAQRRLGEAKAAARRSADVLDLPEVRALLGHDDVEVVDL
ncbi:GGDEF domain-containing protein [Cellulomonas fimi]|uniref:Diguanylate cyclase n=1 Tax=Cellulomonas fimi (strain ATCC 484 / DSM 20113 / JCM 1341 / CCUG 24087 / LMG 16345 / NBRC 15513 / NCIMB 8980 / NCTC 7547 / NRS-133) TaxID=590998 RepID=F4H126_CELFA|nr:GGDEF domain-containing protein [Cellulomonas fimi]AEE47395.1 diguanylate cyclase [Cellulomonas fimi ATCC 484]NNH05775.1 GGDEF domain-containing protein [Cellulomonas fimi]VEH36095.1 Probable diguanylate cyclase YfiN [Cellulomonas fimi]